MTNSKKGMNGPRGDRVRGGEGSFGGSGQGKSVGGGDFLR